MSHPHRKAAGGRLPSPGAPVCQARGPEGGQGPSSRKHTVKLAWAPSRPTQGGSPDPSAFRQHPWEQPDRQQEEPQALSWEGLLQESRASPPGPLVIGRACGPRHRRGLPMGGRALSPTAELGSPLPLFQTDMVAPSPGLRAACPRGCAFSALPPGGPGLPWTAQGPSLPPPRRCGHLISEGSVRGWSTCFPGGWAGAAGREPDSHSFGPASRGGPRGQAPPLPPVHPGAAVAPLRGPQPSLAPGGGTHSPAAARARQRQAKRGRHGLRWSQLSPQGDSRPDGDSHRPRLGKLAPTSHTNLNRGPWPVHMAMRGHEGRPPGPPAHTLPRQDAHAPPGPIRGTPSPPSTKPGPPALYVCLACLVSATSAWGGPGG